MAAEKKDGTIVWYDYDENGAPIGMRVNGEDYLYRKNLQGDITGIYNPIGNLAVEYTYDAWGKLIDTTGFLSGTVGEYNSLRYRGYYYDSDTGLYYLSSRYYDPETGRFVNADGYVQTPTGDLTSINMFAYCNNDPINNFDSTGEFTLTATLGGIALWKIGAFLIGAIATISVTDTLVKTPPKLPPISLPKAKAKPKVETRDKTKDITQPKPPRKDPVHHIVAQGDQRAAESRQILRDVGIEPITDPRNLVVLPQSYHASLHTTAYHNYVTERLRPVAGNRAGIEATLDSIKAEILTRSSAGIRWD